MGLLSLLLSLAAVYLCFNIACGIFLSVYYLVKEKRITDSKEFLNLLFFPATGLGKWIFQSHYRNSLQEPYNEQWYIYKNMIRINWLFILLIIGYECYAFSHLYIMFHNYNSFKKDATDIIGGTGTDIIYHTFGWMLDFSLNIMFLFVGIVLLFTFMVCVFIFILLPKLQLSSIEKQLRGK